MRSSPLSKLQILQLATALEVSEATIRRGIAAGMPIGPGGEVDVEEIRLWFRSRARNAHRRYDGPSEMGKYQSQQTKLYGGGPLTPEEKLTPTTAGAAAGSLAEPLREISDELAAYRRVRRQKEELALGKMRGELMERAAVAEMVAGWVRAFARCLMALEGRVAHLVSDEARALIRQECRDMLEAISRNGEKLRDDGPNEVPAE